MDVWRILTDETGEERFSLLSIEINKFSGNSAEQLGRAVVSWVDLCLDRSRRALEIILLNTQDIIDYRGN